MGPDLAACDVVRHRLGDAAVPRRAAACCCRSSARPTAQALENGEIELRYDPREGSFSAWYFEHRLPIAPERYSEILRTIVKRPGLTIRRRTTPARACFAHRAGTTRHRQSATERRPSRPNSQASPAARTIIARGLHAYRAGPDRPAQVLALHHLLERQHYRLGALAARRQRNQLPALLRHQHARRTARRGSRHVRRDPRHWSHADRRRQAARAAARSHRRAARSAPVFPRLRRLIREAQGTDRRRSTSSSRRFSATTNAASSPACTAPPATNGSTSSRGFWPTTAASSGSMTSGGRSATGRPLDPVLIDAKRRVLGNPAGERIHRPGPPAGAASPPATTRTRDFSADRLRAGARAVHPALPGLPHLSHGGRGRRSRRTHHARDR